MNREMDSENDQMGTLGFGEVIISRLIFQKFCPKKVMLNSNLCYGFHYFFLDVVKTLIKTPCFKKR